MHRRDFLRQTLRTSSLVALSPLVPGFVARTADAAEAGKDRVLVLLELNGGNDGLNTVVPFANDDYHKARPTLHYQKQELTPLSDQYGLNPGLRPLDRLVSEGQVAVVQGVGYPNPNRSHFESMDTWQSADPARQSDSGWLGRGLSDLAPREGGIPALHVGTHRLPLALQGGPAVPSVHPHRSFGLVLDDSDRTSVMDARRGQPFRTSPQREERMRLLRELAQAAQPAPGSDDLLQFVRRSSLEAYTSVERLQAILNDENRSRGYNVGRPEEQLHVHLGLVARLIRAGFGTRIFYVALDGFDTHADQKVSQQQLLTQIAAAVDQFFQQLAQSKDAERVVLMTFSEFGRRVQENGSKGTDHGAASCQFVIGPGVQGGVHGSLPSLASKDLLDGDVPHTLDFRQVYATLLDDWLGIPSRPVLGGRFVKIALLK